MGFSFAFVASGARVVFSTLAFASCMALAAACDSAASASASIGNGNAGSATTLDAGADASDAGPTADDIVFVPGGTLTLDPKATRTLTVQTTPARVFPVRFALLGSASDSAVGDAALSASEVNTDENGIAEVTLTAPSMPATFNVRASVGVGAQTRLSVSVSARNYTTLHVLPSYSGKRPVTQWTATASTGVTCEQFATNPPPDGALSVTAPAGQDLDITTVPVGVALAVTLRAGHYVGGCANQSALSEADGNTVLVYASDRPLNLAATKLSVAFGPTQPSAALTKLMNASATQAEAAMTGGAANDVSVLLDAMHDATASITSRDAFAAARQTHTWDAALTSAFGDGAATRLRAPADRWFTAGLGRFYAADTFAATLGPAKSGATLSLSTVAQVSATDAGFPESFATTWSADSSDTLLLGTSLSWVPSHLVTALALLPATLEIPDAASVEAALADSVDCTLVGQTLLAHGTVAGSAVYDGCDQTCTVTACVSAVAALWQNAIAASGTTTAALTFTGTGPAQVGDDASVTSLVGTWVGQLQVGTDTAPASGPLTAKATSLTAN